MAPTEPLPVLNTKPLTAAQRELYDWLINYIDEAGYSPSIRQMMRAMNLRSPAPIQSRLRNLREKGFVDWVDGEARTLRIVNPPPKGVPLLASLSEGDLVFPDFKEPQRFDIPEFYGKWGVYAVKVDDESLVSEMVAPGDVLVLLPLERDTVLEDGQQILVSVDGDRHLLRKYYGDRELAYLVPTQEIPSSVADLKQVTKGIPQKDLEIAGVLLAVWRHPVS